MITFDTWYLSAHERIIFRILVEEVYSLLS